MIIPKAAPEWLRRFEEHSTARYVAAMEEVSRQAQIHAAIKAQGVPATNARLMAEFDAFLRSLPEGADVAAEINRWATAKIRAKFTAAQSLTQRYPGVAEVAAKHTKPEAGYYSVVQRRTH